jgi:hypothetical protein
VQCFVNGICDSAVCVNGICDSAVCVNGICDCAGCVNVICDCAVCVNWMCDFAWCVNTTKIAETLLSLSVLQISQNQQVKISKNLLEEECNYEPLHFSTNIGKRL